MPAQWRLRSRYRPWLSVFAVQDLAVGCAQASSDAPVLDNTCLKLALPMLTWLSQCCVMGVTIFFQDAIKKTSKDELPDFYNIQLERPKDDAKGYDVLFIDAATKVSG